MTKETICLPLGCPQGGLRSSRPSHACVPACLAQTEQTCACPKTRQQQEIVYATRAPQSCVLHLCALRQSPHTLSQSRYTSSQSPYSKPVATHIMPVTHTKPVASIRGWRKWCRDTTACVPQASRINHKPVTTHIMPVTHSKPVASSRGWRKWCRNTTLSRSSSRLTTQRSTKGPFHVRSWSYLGLSHVRSWSHSCRYCRYISSKGDKLFSQLTLD